MPNSPPPAAPTAGDIIAHYLRNLTIASGKRWTPANDRDMRRLGELLADLGQSGESIPAFLAEPMTVAGVAGAPAADAPRVTVAFDKPATAEDDPNFVRWRQQQREQDDERAVTRMPRGGAK